MTDDAPRKVRFMRPSHALTPLALDDVSKFDPLMIELGRAGIARDVVRGIQNAAATGKTHRHFVCQGCAKVHAALYGASIICGCGARSSAEVLL